MHILVLCFCADDTYATEQKTGMQTTLSFGPVRGSASSAARKGAPPPYQRAASSVTVPLPACVVDCIRKKHPAETDAVSTVLVPTLYSFAA